MNPSLRNKYVKYLFTINLVGHTEYGYFYVDNNLQIIDFDPDIGI